MPSKNGISQSIKSALYWLIEDITKGLLEDDRWDYDFDKNIKTEGDWAKYKEVVSSPDVMKLAITIWSNNIELDGDNIVINGDHASFRCYQYIRSEIDLMYEIKPKLETWEAIENEHDT